jgi:putative nucleotidyltransferase with HDIG domain/PAS domain S-box-containing protein
MRAGDADLIGKFVCLLDALNCGAVLINRAGRVVHANDRLCRMMGRGRDQLVGADLRRLYAGSGEEGREQLRQILEHFDEPREGEFFLPLADGKRLPIVSSAARLGSEPPLSDHRLVTVIDLSFQKEAEAALREQYEIIAELSNTILEQALKLKDYNQTLETKVAQRTADLHAANLDAVYMLAVASEAKDLDTGRHVRRIQRYAKLLAKELGMNDAEAEAVGYSAILHDVGKMHVPDEILKKPGPLTAGERAEVQQHTVIGERILADRPFFAQARRIARSHHENWDGSGYPDGRRGSEIPTEARIVHLADVYDALTSVRVYKPAWTEKDAAAVIEASRGAMFDPEVVSAFTSVYGRGAFDRGLE